MTTQPPLRELRRAFGGLRRKGQRLFGILGNEAGQIAVPDRPGYQYARVERGSERVTLACLGNARARLHTAVIIEQNPVTGEFQIVGLDVETTRAAGDDPTTALFYTEPHAASHEWRADADDILLWLNPNQFYFLRVQPGETTGHVIVQGGPYFVHGRVCWKRTQSDVDLTAYYPPAGAAWVMLCLDAADAITVVQAAGGGDARDIGDLDGIPTGTIALAAVKLTTGAGIDFFSDIIPLWQITQFDASVLANGEVRITDDGLVVGVDYPSLTGPWTFIGTALGECGYDLHGVRMMWDSDFLSLVLIDEGEDQKAAGLIFGDNSEDRFVIGFCDMSDVLHALVELTTTGGLTVAHTVAAGDYQDEDYDLEWTKIGLMTTIAGLYAGVGWQATWAQASAVAALIDLGAAKDLLLGYLPATAADKIQLGFMLPGGGLDTALTITQDGNLAPKAGATFDGVDVSAHVADPAAHHTRYTDAEAVTAMGAEGDTNPLNHDRYTDAEALAQGEAAVATHTALVNPHGTGFVDLADTPSSYSGHGGQYVTVSPAENGLVFVDSGGGGSVTASSQNLTHRWHADGPLAVATEIDGIYAVIVDSEITLITAYLMTAGSSDTIADIEVSSNDGNTWTSLCGTNRPTLGSGARTNSTVPDVVIVMAGDLVRMSLDAVGTGARSLSVQIFMEELMILKFGCVPLLGQSFANNSATYVDAGASGFRLDMSKIPATATVKLQGRMYTDGPAVYVRLYDYTNNAAIAGSEISTTETSAVLVESADVRAALPAGEAVIGIQLHCDGSAYGQIRSALLMIEW